MRLSERCSFTRAFLLLGYLCLLIFIGNLIYLALTPVVPPARKVFSAETYRLFGHMFGNFLLWLFLSSYGSASAVSMYFRASDDRCAT